MAKSSDKKVKVKEVHIHVGAGGKVTTDLGPGARSGLGLGGGALPPGAPNQVARASIRSQAQATMAGIAQAQAKMVSKGHPQLAGSLGSLHAQFARAANMGDQALLSRMHDQLGGKFSNADIKGMLAMNRSSFASAKVGIAGAREAASATAQRAAEQSALIERRASANRDRIREESSLKAMAAADLRREQAATKSAAAQVKRDNAASDAAAAKRWRDGSGQRSVDASARKADFEAALVASGGNLPLRAASRAEESDTVWAGTRSAGSLAKKTRDNRASVIRARKSAARTAARDAARNAGLIAHADSLTPGGRGIGSFGLGALSMVGGAMQAGAPGSLYGLMGALPGVGGMAVGSRFHARSDMHARRAALYAQAGAMDKSAASGAAARRAGRTGTGFNAIGGVMGLLGGMAATGVNVAYKRQANVADDLSQGASFYTVSGGSGNGMHHAIGVGMSTLNRRDAMAGLGFSNSQRRVNESAFSIGAGNIGASMAARGTQTAGQVARRMGVSLQAIAGIAGFGAAGRMVGQEDNVNVASNLIGRSGLRGAAGTRMLGMVSQQLQGIEFSTASMGGVDPSGANGIMGGIDRLRRAGAGAANAGKVSMNAQGIMGSARDILAGPHKLIAQTMAMNMALQESGGYGIDTPFAADALMQTPTRLNERMARGGLGSIADIATGAPKGTSDRLLGIGASSMSGLPAYADVLEPNRAASAAMASSESRMDVEAMSIPMEDLIVAVEALTDVLIGIGRGASSAVRTGGNFLDAANSSGYGPSSWVEVLIGGPKGQAVTPGRGDQ